MPMPTFPSTVSEFGARRGRWSQNEILLKYITIEIQKLLDLFRVQLGASRRCDVKRAVFAFLIVGELIANKAIAEPQPLTRAACEAVSGWAWDETANVCDVDTKAIATTIKPQPLTKADCDAAGMSWNDNVLACEEKSKGSRAAAQPVNPTSTVLIDIDKSKQEVTVFVDGVQKYQWPVSTGKRGYATPSGTYTALSMNEVWYSKEWDNAPMPHAIFFMKDGHAIHGSYEVRNLGKPASHGCVRISPQNATILFDLVKNAGLPNTQVVLSGETAGGEAKLANSTKSRKTATSRSQARAAWAFGPENFYGESSAEPRRGGFFRRLFGRR
jgi:lipoprotein-anchoring transpeptidase ErfK/SrfK